MYINIPSLPLFPLLPFPLTWNPPSCDRIRPPLLWVARKLTLAFPSPAHLDPYPKSRPPGVSQTQNRHSLGRHCSLTATNTWFHNVANTWRYSVHSLKRLPGQVLKSSYCLAVLLRLYTFTRGLKLFPRSPLPRGKYVSCLQLSYLKSLPKGKLIFLNVIFKIKIVLFQKSSLDHLMLNKIKHLFYKTFA
jgi:hypothetical protein